EFVDVDARTGNLVGFDAPNLCDVRAVSRIGDVARAGQLIALLAVLAPALTVALAGDRRVAAIRPADASRRKHDMDRPEDVLDAVAVVLDAAGVEEETRLRGAPQCGGLANRRFRDAGRLGGPARRPRANRRGNLVETDRVALDEVVIEVVVLD